MTRAAGLVVLAPMQTQAFSQPAALGFAMEGLRRGLDEATIQKYGQTAIAKMNSTTKVASDKRAAFVRSIADEIKKNIPAAK